MKGEPEDALRLRITVVDPPKGVLLKMQRGREQLVDPAVSAAPRVSFDLEVRLGTRAGGLPNFIGDFAQGPADKRFVYINSGTLAGQSDSPWSRRAKIPLTAISTALIAQARRTGGVLAAEYEGTARDGGPSCATVPLIGGDWHVEPE